MFSQIRAGLDGVLQPAGSHFLEIFQCFSSAHQGADSGPAAGSFL